MDKYSPPRSGVPVRGLARIPGQDKIHEFRPGEEYWSKRVTERARKIGAPEGFWDAKISHHVEFETVAWMIEAGEKVAEIIINRTPCGYRQDLGELDGCHQYLQGFMPKGTRLHVYGTDENGKKTFITTYEGRNER